MDIKNILHLYEGRETPYPDNFAGIGATLRYLGYDVVSVDIRQLKIEDYESIGRRFAPDMALCVSRKGAELRRAVELHRRRSSAPLVAWYLEDPNGVFRDNTVCLSSSFDFWFTIDKKMIPFYKTRTYFLPLFFDHFYYYERYLVRSCDVVYIGQLGHSRSSAMLTPYLQVITGQGGVLCTERPIGSSDIRAARGWRKAISACPSKWRRIAAMLGFWVEPASVFGEGSWFEPRDEHEKALVNSKCKIAIGLSRVWGYWEEPLRQLLPSYPLDASGFFYQPKGRSFEAVGAGAMLLNDYYPELEEMFDIGKEIVSFEFGDLEDFSGKLAWYIKHDSERERIAAAGYARARKEHSLANRLRQMIRTVEKEI